MQGISPYENCSTYETENFIFRLVKESDAEELLQCYSDLAAVKIMNSDYCTSDFHYTTIDEMRDCIIAWLAAYAQKDFVRFSIIEKKIQEAVGTIELFDDNEVGVLRVDLRSNYETRNLISEIIQMSNKHFYDEFGVKYIIIKAIPEASERLSALIENGFLPDDKFRPGLDYYVQSNGNTSGG